MPTGRYLRQARQHVCMILVVKRYKGQLNAQQLGVGLWQPPTACHKKKELLLELNVPAIHNLYSSELHMVEHRRCALQGRNNTLV